MEHQSVTESAHPANLLGRNACYQRKIADIFCHHSARTNQAVPAQGDATQHGGIGADTGAFFDKGLSEFAFPLNKTPRVDHIGEHHART